MGPKIILQGQRRRSAWKTLLATALLVVAVPVLFGLFRNARLPDLLHARERAIALEAERSELKSQLRALQTDAEEQTRQIAYLAHGQEIDKQACSDARASLLEAQGESAKLREQLAFYRGLVAPETVKAGMRVQEFRATPAAEPGKYSYSLMLIRPLRRERIVTGNVEVQFIGRDQTGAQRRYLLSEQAAGQNGRLLFSFKQFQDFSGEFSLPANFRPQRAVVTLETDGGSLPKIDEVFEWNQILGKPE